MSANMKAKMVMVEGALATAEKVCAYYKVEGHIKLAALGAFSRNCILAVIEKKHKDLPFFDSVEAAGVDFIQSLNEQMGNPGIGSPWVVPSKPESAASSGKQKTPKRAHGEKTIEPLWQNFAYRLFTCCAFYLIRAGQSIGQAVQNMFFSFGSCLEAESIRFDGQNQQCCHAEGQGFHRGNDRASEE